MKKRTVCAAAIVAALCLASAAKADFDIEITTINQDTEYTEVVTFTDHEFGTSESLDSGGNPDGLFPIHVTSGVSMADGWDYQISLDYSDYEIGFFGISALSEAVIDINTPDFAGVSDAAALDALGNAIGTVSFTDDRMTMTTAGLALQMGGEVATIHWNTIVPSPGAIALLGIAGFVGVRRRRR